MLRRRLLHAGLALWLCVVCAAFFLMWRYKMTPGPAGETRPRWPDDSAIRSASDRANVVMFAHPQCPCTVASMTELERLAAELGDRVRIHVALVRPPDSEPDIMDGSIADRAHAIRGADVFVDDGTEATRFGAQTSGATFVYGAGGELLFHGGLTIARGHEGRGPAHDRIVELVAGAASPGDTPTFGCELGVR